MNNIKNYIKEINGYIKETPKIGIILGSGLGVFTSSIQNSKNIDYISIKKYPKSTVSGHQGRFIIGRINNTPIICADGRFHYYEGYEVNTTTLPIDIFYNLININ